MTVLLILVIAFALAFDYINGFHDTANAIATVVSTRVLTPTAAIIMAAVLNFAGALVFTNVAKTIAGGIVAHEQAGSAPFATEAVVLAAVIGAIATPVGAQTLCPDGSFVPGDSCTLSFDGSRVIGGPVRLPRRHAR